MRAASSARTSPSVRPAAAIGVMLRSVTRPSRSIVSVYVAFSWANHDDLELIAHAQDVAVLHGADLSRGDRTGLAEDVVAELLQGNRPPAR